MRRRRSESGFGAVEVAVTIALAGFVVLGGLQMFSSSMSLSDVSRQHMRAAAEHRQGQERLSWLLRAAATTDGFDAETQRATSITLTRVVDAVSGEPVVGEPSTLSWVAVSEPVPGIAAPGAVVWTESGTTRTLVENVSGSGFWIRRDAGWLTLHLTTYLAEPDGNDVVTIRSTCVIRPRNEP